MTEKKQMTEKVKTEYVLVPPTVMDALAQYILSKPFHEVEPLVFQLRQCKNKLVEEEMPLAVLAKDGEYTTDPKKAAEAVKKESKEAA